MNRQLLIVALALLAAYSPARAQTPTPTQPLEDNFADKDNTPLTAHTMDIGKGWTGLDNAGNFKIRNDKGQLVGAASGSEAAVAAETGAADVVITADLVSGRNTDATTNNDAGIVFRCGAGGWFLASTNRAAEKIQLFKYSGGCTLVAGADCALATDTAYSAKVVTNGTAIAFTVGTTTVSYTDTFNQGATQHGVRIYREDPEETPSTVDNFTCVPASGGKPLPPTGTWAVGSPPVLTSQEIQVGGNSAGFRPGTVLILVDGETNVKLGAQAADADTFSGSATLPKNPVNGYRNFYATKEYL